VKTGPRGLVDTTVDVLKGGPATAPADDGRTPTRRRVAVPTAAAAAVSPASGRLVRNRSVRIKLRPQS
jgi:hypothetical protein